MALIKCNECGNDMSDRAEHCPKCGWVAGLTKGPARTSPLKPGDFLSRTRRAHWRLVVAFGGLGFIALLDIDAVTGAGRLSAALLGMYLLALVLGRAFFLRDASLKERRLACFDLLEIAALTLAVSFVGGFWYGFSMAIGGAQDLKDMYAQWSLLFGTLSTGTLAFAVVVSVVTLAAESARD